MNGVSASNPSGRTYAQEMQNFAIWYSFYRTRIQMMQGASGIAFSALDQNSRVGFHTLHENDTLFTNIVDFTTTNKNTWFTKLYSVAPNGGTNLPDGVWRIGELFSGNLSASTLPGATDPLDSLTGKCQPNFHLLSTDGYWNSDLAYTSRGNNDKTVPSLTNLPGATGFTVGSNFPRPYYEGSTSTSNNVADLAMYYWIRDIRSTLADKVKDAVAPWQHVTMYGLSIGARGTISYPTGIDAITGGTSNWPAADGAGGPEGVDDLWHGAVNTRGKFFNASNPRNLAESIVSALADFTDQSGTGVGVGLGGAQLSTTNQYAYKTSYEAGLWGDVKKYGINITTGVLPVDTNGNPTSPPVWSAATQLDAQAAVSGSTIGWDTRRRIVTINTSTNASVPFRLASLSTAQQASLNAGWSSVPSAPTAGAVLNFLRGDKSNEGVGTTNFRTRSHILGDIVYSSAVPVGAPSAPYSDTGAAARRTPVITRSRPRRRAGPQRSMSAPTTECCTRSTTRPRTAARKPGPTFLLRSLPMGTRTIRPTQRRRRFSSARFPFGEVGFRFMPTSSTSTRLRAWRTSISQIRIPPRRRRLATTGEPCWSAALAQAAARCMRSTSPIR